MNTSVPVSSEIYFAEPGCTILCARKQLDDESRGIRNPNTHHGSRSTNRSSWPESIAQRAFSSACATRKEWPEVPDRFHPRAEYCASRFREIDFARDRDRRIHMFPDQSATSTPDRKSTRLNSSHI